MEAKLTNMLRRKERKNRKDMQVSIGVDEEDLLYTLKINCKGKRSVGKANKGINVKKYIIGFKKEEKRENER